MLPYTHTFQRDLRVQGQRRRAVLARPTRQARNNNPELFDSIKKDRAAEAHRLGCDMQPVERRKQGMRSNVRLVLDHVI